MSAFQRPPPDQVALHAQLTWMRDELARQNERLRGQLQRGQLKPERAEYLTRMPRAIIATLERLVKTEGAQA